MEIAELPPWQSAQPRCTVFVGCIVGSSVEVWQETQPADFCAASSGDCPRKEDGSPGVRAGGVEVPPAARRKENAETPSTQRLRRADGTDWRSVRIICVPQKVNFTEPKSENSVRL